MPALPAVPGALRVEFKIGDNASIEAGSRFFLSYSGGPPSSTDLNTLAGDVASHWTDHFAGIVLEGEALHDVTITDMSSSTGSIGTWTGSEEGTSAGNPLPASACALVNHEISRRYRGGRPRTYVRCGRSQDLNGTNEWTTGFQSSVLEAWQDWIASILAVSTLSITLENIINISYYEGFTPFETPSGRYKNIPNLRTGGPLKDNIVSSVVAIKVASQRRRLNI